MSYSTEVLADSPVVYFRCQEASGFIQDSSGSARHATASPGGNNAVYHQSSPITAEPSDWAINFATGTNMTVPDAAALDLTDTWTMEAWVKLLALTNFDDRYIITKGANAYSMWVRTTGYFGINAPTVGTPCTSTTIFPDTTGFHHLVATKSGGTVHLYMDTVDVTGTYTANTYANTAETLFIGSSRVNDAFVSAYLDEVAVYPTALSSSRVAAHYAAAGAGGFGIGRNLLTLGVG